MFVLTNRCPTAARPTVRPLGRAGAGSKATLAVQTAAKAATTATATATATAATAAAAAADIDAAIAAADFDDFFSNFSYPHWFGAHSLLRTHAVQTFLPTGP